MRKALAVATVVGLVAVSAVLMTSREAEADGYYYGPVYYGHSYGYGGYGCYGSSAYWRSGPVYYDEVFVPMPHHHAYGPAYAPAPPAWHSWGYGPGWYYGDSEFEYEARGPFGRYEYEYEFDYDD